MSNICDISLFDFERSSIFSHITFRQFFISSISSTLVHLFVFFRDIVTSLLIYLKALHY